MYLYALTIFSGAFLLFQVQPLLAKYILPWFGGGPGVWTICLLFFQVVLLGGYAYAHISSRWLKPRVQAALHATLLIAALAFLPITPNDAWKPRSPDNPIGQILMLLAANIGLPYLVLSSTAPLMQRWFTRAHPGVSPYRLYALSNAGSLLALLSYPFYFETHFTRKAQAFFWGCGLVTYAVCGGLCAFRLWRIGDGELSRPGSVPDTSRPTPIQKGLWISLSACASVLLLATTNKLCRDMLVIPFLWILPLALYLLSFIICFDNPRWYVRSVFAVALVTALGCYCWSIFRGEHWSARTLVLAYSSALFICCMVCHGELYRLRPGPSHLTQYYLVIAAGGALGGLFVAVIAPLIFNGYFELHTGILLCGALYVVTCCFDRNRTTRDWLVMACVLPLAILGSFDRLLAEVSVSEKDLAPYLQNIRIAMWILLLLAGACAWIYRSQLQRARPWHGITCGWLSFGVVALAISLWITRERLVPALLTSSRNFYGRIRVVESVSKEPPGRFHVLLHERIMHGWQFVDPPQSAWPTLYFSEQSGVGLAMEALSRTNRRIGIVGMGAGTVATYARSRDYVRIYEINPEVARVAKSQFTYMANSKGVVEVALGDARLSLEREPAQRFDLLVLDAFSGDNIPVHLLTAEAFEIYQRHLVANGVIAAHVSNLYLDLEPVLANLARHFGYQMAVINCSGDTTKPWLRPSRWILLSKDQEFMNSGPIRQAASAVWTRQDLPLWSDDFASLYQILLPHQDTPAQPAPLP